MHGVAVLDTCNYMEVTCKCMEVDYGKKKKQDPDFEGVPIINYPSTRSPNIQNIISLIN